jgi:hypothetical protein
MTRQSYPLPDDLPPATGFAPFSEPDVRAVGNYVNTLAAFLRQVTTTLRNTTEGKLNAVGDVTLTANAASTTLVDIRIGPDSFIGLMPTTANAAAALASTYVSSRGDGTATITHANNAQTDKIFTYIVIG